MMMMITIIIINSVLMHVLPQQPSGQLPSQHKKDEMTTVKKGSGISTMIM
jgi:hypothetical protein